jgi:hypothetical protein
MVSLSVRAIPPFRPKSGERMGQREGSPSGGRGPGDKVDCRLFGVPLPHDTRATSISMIRAEDLLRLTTTAHLNRIAETIRFHGI